MNKYDIIHTIYPMPKASVDKLVENITEVAYPKSSLILEAGKTERNIFFVGKGIVRAYVEAKGKEITFWIGAEGATVVSLKSYIANAPGYETVEFIPLLFTSAAERYEVLLKNNPELQQRIPLECLATYLGITPVSLSRIRAGIGKRQG